MNAVKGFAVRFFAALRMTALKSYIVKCTNVLHSGLADEKKLARKSRRFSGHIPESNLGDEHYKATQQLCEF